MLIPVNSSKLDIRRCKYLLFVLKYKRWRGERVTRGRQKAYLAGDFEHATFVVRVQAHYEGHGRVEKMVQTRGQYRHVDVLPREGKQERGYALGHHHELVKVGAPEEHLILQQHAREQLDQTVRAEPREHVPQRVI